MERWEDRYVVVVSYSHEEPLFTASFFFQQARNAKGSFDRETARHKAEQLSRRLGAFDPVPLRQKPNVIADSGGCRARNPIA